MEMVNLFHWFWGLSVLKKCARFCRDSLPSLFFYQFFPSPPPTPSLSLKVNELFWKPRNQRTPWHVIWCGLLLKGGGHPCLPRPGQEQTKAVVSLLLCSGLWETRWWLPFSRSYSRCPARGGERKRAATAKRQECTCSRPRGAKGPTGRLLGCNTPSCPLPALCCLAQGVSALALGLCVLSIQLLLSSHGKKQSCVCGMDGSTGSFKQCSSCGVYSSSIAVLDRTSLWFLCSIDAVPLQGTMVGKHVPKPQTRKPIFSRYFYLFD